MDFRKYPVLCVDDEKPNLLVLKHALSSTFEVHFANSGEEALQLLREIPFAVLLADQRMPRMTGVDLAEQVYAQFPDVERVIITAYSDLQATIDAINRGRVSQFIKKPWTAEELVAVISGRIAAYHQRILAKQFQLRMLRFDGMVSLGLAALGLAHDLRQPLNSMLPSLDAIQFAVAKIERIRPADDQVLGLASEVRKATTRIQEGIGVLRRIADTVFASVKQPAQELERFDLVEISRSALVITRTTVLKVARLRMDLSEVALPVLGSSSRMVQLLVNLLINAAQSFGSRNSLENEVLLAIQGAPGNHAQIVVEDNGSGISEKERQHVFDPLFTTKRLHGSGVGLSICRQVVEEFGGTIKLESQEGQGTRFVVDVPLWHQRVEAQ